MTEKDARESVKPAKKAPPAPAAQKSKDDVVARAGGYVDRGDGNGWVPEEK